ncbi:hypothetical protein ULMS_28760 [Patiriisocius marinistellae]|uniref:AsmA domain-containing protein n=1 Tax=Patiriisocius marinistellae TaxID=2494560 RepID=A0A5J4G0S8_9FLAO|nr:AsmA family protein [Patiriisocius marinistellae]GEQ87368.1 hypothetical protein ULMS_28760 [Patiriisocius marinistellae]
MKKFLKITGIVVLILIIALVASPFLFKDSLEKLLVKNINKNLNATVAWNDFDLSLFSSFPDAALVISDFSVLNKAPFEGDTLASGKTLKLDMGITQLFKSSDDPIKIDALELDEALVNIRLDSLGNANYDIALKDDAPIVDKTISTEESTGFTFDLQQYALKNSRINYSDDSTQTYLMLANVNHEGTGDFSAAKSKLDTETTAVVSFKMGDVAYLSENNLTLDAVFDMDLENQKYTFLENEAKINELALTFDGFVKINESNNEVDLKFKTPSSNFKNFLGVIPKAYVKELDGVTTTGNFTVNGILKGIIDETKIPTMDIKVRSDNASFKYPSLPKAVQNISINADLINTTGLLQDTYLNIGGLTFKIDDEIFNVNGSIKNFTDNMLVDLALKGTINLANIEKVFPVELDQDLSGVFKADVTTNFDMNSVEKEQYQNIKTNGTASITDFNYADPAFPNPIKIENANITMATGNIVLNDMNATSGQTDLNAKGSIQNLIPWVMAKQDLKGNFNVTSNTFNVNDFMIAETKTATKNSNASKISAEEMGIKIPDFLDATLNFNAKKVIYDDLTLDNAKGTVSIKNETAQLSNVTSSIFGGNIALNGNVTTKSDVPTFTMDLDLSKIDIDQSFSKMPMLKFLAPIAKALQGNMNTTFKLNGNLTKDLTPVLESLGGSAYAQIITAQVDGNQTPLLNALGSQLSFLNLDKLELRDIDTNLSFDNGNIVVKPFDFDVKGIKITAAGSHSLSNSINYNLKMDVPAKYLGSDVTKILTKLDPTEADKMTVALPVGLTGSFTNPKVNLNTKAAVTELTQRIVAKQKDNLIEKGTGILGDLLGGNSNSNNAGNSTNGNTNTGTTTTPPKDEKPKEIIKDVLGGLFGGGKKKKKDSIN